MRIRLLTLLFAFSLYAAAPTGSYITLDVRDVSLADVLALLTAQSGVNVVGDESIRNERVTLRLRHVTFDQALDVLIHSHDLSARRDHDVLLVGTADSMNRRFAGGNTAFASVTHVFRLLHADPDEVAKELGMALPVGTVVVPDKRTASVIVTSDTEALSRAALVVRAADAEVRPESALEFTHAYALRFLKASELVPNLKGVLPENSYVADDAQNAVIITGDKKTQASAARFLESLDVPTPQVLFEVRVADVVPETTSSDVGIEFGGYDLSGQPLPGAATYAFAHNSIAINARLNALLSEGHAKILATPKLVTLNNKEADLLIGETYPVVFYDARLGGQQVQFVDVGVKLRLTPTIGADGSVTAEMHPEYSAIQTFVGGYPVIANRKIDSTLRVKDNETIVLGGLLRDIDSQTVTKVPWLADIPVFGKVFQDRQITRERDEVIFLITPHVIYPNSPPPQR